MNSIPIEFISANIFSTKCLIETNTDKDLQILFNQPDFYYIVSPWNNNNLTFLLIVKYTFTLLVLAIAGVFASNSVLAQTTGGPDLFGYTWEDSNAPSGPAYTWLDITTLPGAVQITGLTDDNAVGPFNFGFDFRYYWNDVNTFRFGSNGWIGLGAQGNAIGNIAHCFPSIPTQGGVGDNYVAPFLTDLNYVSNSFPNPGSAWYWSNGQDSLIIQYNNVPWWRAGTPDWIGSNTFQVVFSGLDSSITFNYNDMDPASFNNTPFCDQDLIIGMENVTGNIGLVHNLEVVPADQYSVRFNYPDSVTFQVPDATPAWAANSDNAGQIFVSPSTVNLEVNVANVGNADITTDINVDGVLQSLSFNTVWSDQTSVPGGLVAGADTTVIFPKVVNLNTAGQYYFNVVTANGSDINQTNDDNTVEISVVECVNDSFTLTYATGNTPDRAVGWSGGGGDSGAGVFFAPFGDSITLESVDLYVVSSIDANNPTSSFWIKVYDDSGIPGALLDSVYVPVANVVVDAWNTVSLTSPITISNGGFFVSWIMGGDTALLGAEAFGPISRRTYEVLGGNWSPYRQAQSEDFLIRVNATGCDSLVAVDDPIANFELQTYPNPTTEAFKVRFDLPYAGEAQFTMMDRLGRTVFRRGLDVNAGTTTFTYDASGLSSGVYFLSMQFDGQKVTHKVIVSK